MTIQQPELTHPPTGSRGEHRDWWLEPDDHGVTALDATGMLARVDVREDADRAHLLFWLGDRLPGAVSIALTRRAFAHPALRPHRPVAVALPDRGVDVLTELREHLAGAITHVAGSTCLVVGRVR